MFSLNNIFNMLIEVEYLSIGFIFSFSSKKREFFALKVILSVLIFLPMSFFSYNISLINDIFSQTLNFFLVFLSGPVVFFLCFDYSFTSSLFFSIISYSFRHCIYLFWMLLSYSLTDLFHIDLSQFSFYWILMAIVSVLLALPFFILLYKRIRQYPYVALPRMTMVLVSVVSLLITIVLNNFVLFSTFPKELNSIRYVLNIFAFMSSFMIIVILIGNVKQRKLEGEIEAVNQLRYQEEKQYEMNKQSIDLINIKCHDLRHQIRSLKESNASINKEELDNIEKAIRIYDTRMKTGNPSLDLILQEKSLLCNQKGIAFDCIIDGKLLSFMKESDIYSLFGNIVDNAMDACLKIDKKDKRTIALKVKKAANGVFAYEENPFVGELEFDKGLPISRKDKRYHGFGMKSIENIVKMYHGTLKIKSEEGRFCLSLFFPNRIED